MVLRTATGVAPVAVDDVDACGAAPDADGATYIPLDVPPRLDVASYMPLFDAPPPVAVAPRFCGATYISSLALA